MGDVLLIDGLGCHVEMGCFSNEIIPDCERFLHPEVGELYPEVHGCEAVVVQGGEDIGQRVSSGFDQGCDHNPPRPIDAVVADDLEDEVGEVHDIAVHDEGEPYLFLVAKVIQFTDEGFLLSVHVAVRGTDGPSR